MKSRMELAPHFSLLEPFFEVLYGGKVHLLTIDEFGESLHPVLTRAVIRLFHSAETNPNGAQIVFSTHDTSLLSAKIFRRDQIWFTEKTPQGSTLLYSLPVGHSPGDRAFLVDEGDGDRQLGAVASRSQAGKFKPRRRFFRPAFAAIAMRAAMQNHPRASLRDAV